MDRRLEWIGRQGALAVALYVAIVGQAEWLQYAITAIVWATLALTVWTVPDVARMRAIAASTLVPRASAMAFDLAVLAAMFLAHWYWTAFAYAMACGCAALNQSRAARG